MLKAGMPKKLFLSEGFIQAFDAASVKSKLRGASQSSLLEQQAFATAFPLPVALAVTCSAVLKQEHR